VSAPPPAPGAPLHVVCLADDAATLATIHDALAQALPGAVLHAATATDAATLPPAGVVVMAATLGVDGRDAGPAVADAGRQQVERLLHAGTLALTLRHTLSNPLAALLAEAQMLELEALPGETGAAVERVVSLCRRVIASVRELDVSGKGGEGHGTRDTGLGTRDFDTCGDSGLGT
jgi:signal transduction histidine kinase